MEDKHDRGRRSRNHHHRQRHRSRSLSEDFEDERRHRRRREQGGRDSAGDRSSYVEDRDQRHSEDKYRPEKVEAQRRRSRSPVDQYPTSKLREGSSKYRTRDDYSPNPRSSRDKDLKTQRSDAGRQLTTKKDRPLPSQEASFSLVQDPSQTKAHSSEKPDQEKEKPNYNPTGLLAAASNTVSRTDGKSIVLKYHEPPEARKPPPKDQWKLFVFKGAEILETIELGVRSCWLIGRELAVVDLPAEHPSISKQHAVIQFRWIEKRNEFGDKLGRVRPYLIDLESANGTMMNKGKISSSRYVELRDKDMIQFGDSTREYVLMTPPKD